MTDFSEYTKNIQVKQQYLLERFKIGDLVTPYYAAQNDFYGIVVDINPVETKLYVDYNGTIRQEDPQDVRVVLKQRVSEKKAKKASRRKSSVVVNSRISKIIDAVYYKCAPSMFKVSQDELETGAYLCPGCGETMMINFDVVDGRKCVCQNCNRVINKENLI